MSNKKDTTTMYGATKDENGRYPAAAYTPETISTSLAEIFSSMGLPKALGLTIVNNMQGNDGEGTYTAEQLSAVKNVSEDLFAMFTAGGATRSEVIAGCDYLLADVAKYDNTDILAVMDSIQGKGDGNETLH